MQILISKTAHSLLRDGFCSRFADCEPLLKVFSSSLKKFRTFSFQKTLMMMQI
jgi:hypothetical protein